MRKHRNRNDVLRQAFIEAEVEYFNKLSERVSEEWVPSDSFEKRMDALVHRPPKRSKRHPSCYICKIACILVIFAVFLGSVCYVDAIRIPVIDFFVDVYEKFSSIDIHCDKGIDTTSSINSKFLPKNIPSDYSQVSSSNHDSYHVTSYKNDLGSSIIFYQYPIFGSEFILNTEDIEYHDFSFGSINGEYYIKSGYLSLYWISDNYAFLLSVPESYSLNDAISIAESVEPVN